jgi:hypothetical protein
MSSTLRALVDTERISKRLLLVRIVAILDAFLLVPLVYGFVTGSDVHKEILGPIHGVGFLLLVYLVGMGAVEKLWGWWFPALVVVTLGPPGSLIGDLTISRRIRA